jgi:hypothetical protein
MCRFPSSSPPVGGSSSGRRRACGRGEHYEQFLPQLAARSDLDFAPFSVNASNVAMQLVFSANMRRNFLVDRALETELARIETRRTRPILLLEPRGNSELAANGAKSSCCGAVSANTLEAVAKASSSLRRRLLVRLEN